MSYWALNFLIGKHERSRKYLRGLNFSLICNMDLNVHVYKYIEIPHVYVMAGVTKQWPTGQIWPATCFSMAITSEFYSFTWWKIQIKTMIVTHENNKKFKFVLGHSHAHSFILYCPRLALCFCGKIEQFVSDQIDHKSLNIYDPFTEKVSWLLLEKNTN